MYRRVGIQLAHQRQAYSRAFVRTSALTFDAMKTFENVLQFGFRNTDAGVADRQLDPAAGIAKTHLDPSCKSKFESVGKEIEYDLFPHIAVDISRPRQLIAGNIQRKPCPLANRMEIRRQIACQEG